MKTKQIKCLLDVLSQAGLMPYLYHNATTGSTYIKFNRNIGGTLRIADHKQRKKYSYRWNLRSDVRKIKTVQKKHECYYYPFGCFEEMVRDMIDEAKKLTEGKALMKNIVGGMI